uniref:Voltage-dependent calcium channel subunit alpha-2/delta-3 n=1 Tax=Macrostomum lignano TaxID=282301 RepID=A0A1I8H5M0_9PLAT
MLFWFNYPQGNQSFLGLIGTDVTVKEMNAMVPYHKFGPNGYAFAVNSNGYIVFHPELKAQYGWLADSPNVDLIEVEFDSELKRSVRKKIIKATGRTEATFQLYEERIPNFLKISDSVHTYWAERNYAFTNVNRTAFAW